ncbi:MAG: helix-turn-helix domain-containing protein [Phycisphaeraceae bacterium]|nr:helix-turn-helix domain-containing protein [Phycisphaeraceae bacterium]
MARQARFEQEAIARLEAELQYAPSDVLLRIAEHAESLIATIEPAQVYPSGWVVFRLTGFRSDRADALLGGRSLVRDLGVLVLRLSARARVDAIGDREPLTLTEVARRLGVSAKTVQRLRREGLVCHTLVDPVSGASRVVCFRDAMARFRARSEARLSAAARFTRLSDESIDLVRREARRLAAAGLSLNQAALRIAQREGRAHETMRRLLRDLDAREGCFGGGKPLRARDLEFIRRARRRGVGVSALAVRFRRTTATIRRADARARGHALARIDIPCVVLPTFTLVDAETIILAPRSVAEHLDERLPVEDVLVLLDAADRAAAPDEPALDQVLAASHLLRWRARTALAALATWPGARAVDRIETDLRWAGQLRARAITMLLPVALGRLPLGLGLRPAVLPGELLAGLVGAVIGMVCREADEGDPAGHARPVRRVVLAADRLAGAVADRLRGRPLKAHARHVAGVIRPDPPAPPARWARLTDLPDRLRPYVPALSPALRAVIEVHYGLGAGPAQSIAEIAGATGEEERQVTRRIDGALDRLRQMASAAPYAAPARGAADAGTPALESRPGGAGHERPDG